MSQPYVDASKMENSHVYEFSIHGLNSDHLTVIRYALEQYAKIANADMDDFVNRIEKLDDIEMELLVDAAVFRKAANDLVKLTAEMD